MNEITYVFLDNNDITIDAAVFENILTEEEKDHYKNIYKAASIMKIDDNNSIYGIGCIWDKQANKFKPPQPHSSWLWDEVEWSWICPVPVPEDIATSLYYWDQENQQWVWIKNLEN